MNVIHDTTSRMFVILCLALVMLASATAESIAQTAAQVVARDKPAVVFIVCATNSGGQSGSGFIVSSNATSSIIVTANHVIEGTTEVDVILDSDVHKRYAATVLRRDHVRDVALLSIDVGGRQTLDLENTAAISEGTGILVMGYPRATLRFFRQIEGDDLRPSVHSGIVSAIRLGGEIVQFDAAIDHGDSGGPIIDSANGKVVAIVRGSPLDQSYAARGMEQALPGSGFGPSSDTIANVAGTILQNARTASSMAIAPSPTSRPQRNSASYRLGYGIPHSTITGDQSQGAAINGVVDARVLDRLVQYLKGDNSLYLIPLTLSSDAVSDSQHLAGYCEDNRLNAVAAPSYAWNLTGGPRYNGFGTLVGYSGNATATLSLVIIDCYGEPFFAESKSKSENRYFAHRTPDREVADMANDLLDQIINDFANRQGVAAAQWQSLLKVGIAFDPADPSFHSLFFFLNKPEGYVVSSVVPGGPADVAGIRPQDILLRINDVNVAGVSRDQIRELMNSPEYKITVQRPGGPTTLVVHPLQYADVVKIVQH